LNKIDGSLLEEVIYRIPVPEKKHEEQGVNSWLALPNNGWTTLCTKRVILSVCSFPHKFKYYNPK